MTRTIPLLILLVVVVSATPAQTTAFTYQGHLVAGGVPANGNYDFQFSLFSVSTGGSQIGLGVVVNNVTVTSGTFNALVNFGSQFSGLERFLEIRVRPAGQGSFTTLTPRQIITSTPYAVKSANSELLDGFQASQFVLTTDARLTDARAPLPNSTSYIQNRTTPQTASNFNISGNGTLGGTLSVGEGSAFQKSVDVGTTLSVAQSAAVGSGLTVGGTLTVNSPANITGAVNTGSQFNIGGNLALGRSRLELSNPSPTPHGYAFEVLASPGFLVLRNDSGNTIMTFASDGKVGIGDNNPSEATLEIGGTIAVSNLGGADGEQLCRDGNLIRACSVVPASNAASGSSSHIERLEATIRNQQAQIEKHRNEVEELKQIVCSIAPAVSICPPKK